jgi:AraC-like DNA-binding protein
MIFNLKMYEPKKDYAIVKSVGYESVLTHSHEFVEIVYVENGTAIQKLNYETINLKKGDLFVIADDSEHSIRPTCEENDFRLINIIFKKNFIDFDYSVFYPITPFNILHNNEFISIINTAIQKNEEHSRFSSEAVKGCVYLLLSNIAESYSVMSKGKEKSNRNRAYVMMAVKYISENFYNKIGLKEIADHVGLSIGYLQKIFRKERQTSIIEYLLRYRVEQSCKQLIETDKAIAEISYDIGFSDPKNFHYTFKKIFGTTPNEYRLSHKRG